MQRGYEPEPQRRGRRRRYRRGGLHLWHKFVLLVGYAGILYWLARGVIYALALLEGIK